MKKLMLIAVLMVGAAGFANSGKIAKDIHEKQTSNDVKKEVVTKENQEVNSLGQKTDCVDIYYRAYYRLRWEIGLPESVSDWLADSAYSSCVHGNVLTGNY